MNTSDQTLSKPHFIVPGLKHTEFGASLAAWDRALNLDRIIDEAISTHQIVGAVVVAAHHGETVYRRAAGYADRETQRPVRAGGIFRLASMTKAIVSVAALTLMDRGEINLDDPVTRWLPEFRPTLADGRAPVISIRHLITHTAGLGYGFLEAADGPYHRLGISDGLDASGLTLEENLQRIAAAPLLFEPGTRWHYSVAVDVLGALPRRRDPLFTGGAGLLRPQTAAAMTRNAIGDLSSAPGFGWGLGVQVLNDPVAAQVPLHAGAWNWGGVYGTHFWVDPMEGLSVVALTNTAVAGMIGTFPSALQRAAYST